MVLIIYHECRSKAILFYSIYIRRSGYFFKPALISGFPLPRFSHRLVWARRSSQAGKRRLNVASDKKRSTGGFGFGRSLRLVILHPACGRREFSENDDSARNDKRRNLPRRGNDEGFRGTRFGGDRRQCAGAPLPRVAAWRRQDNGSVGAVGRARHVPDSTGEPRRHGHNGNGRSCPWRTLGPELQEIMVRSWNEALDAIKDKILAYEGELRIKLKDVGVEVIELKDREKWVEAMKPLYDKFAADKMDLVKRIQSVK